MNDEVTEPGFPQEVLAELRDPQFDFVAQQLRASLRRTVLGRESPPARAGRFIVIRSAGQGAMGRVYEAYDPDLERKVAIKVLRARGASARAALLREGRALARLSHPSIVTVFEVGTLDDTPDVLAPPTPTESAAPIGASHHATASRPLVFVAMEWVGGGTLRRWLEQESRSVERVLDMFVAAGDALATAHREDVVHGDFKPDNVLLDANGRPKVVDFGLARIRRAPPPTSDGVSTSAAPLVTGPFGGTPAYAAPEISTGAPPDARADQYSFCMALAEALWHERPRRDADGEIVLPTRGTVPQWLSALVLTGLARDPGKRHPSLALLIERLRRDPQALRRRRWAFAIGALALVGVVAWGSSRPSAATCPDPAPIIAATWNPARRAALRERLLDSDLPFASDLVERLLANVDLHDEAWRTEMTAACEATVVERVQSQEVLDRRRACLERDRRDLDITLAVVEERGGASLMRALDAVDGLAQPGACAQIGALDELPSAEDAETIASIADHIGRAYALDRTGADPSLSMAEARTAYELAQGLDDPRQHARANAALGRAYDRTGDYAHAREYGERSLWLAYRNDDHVGVARAATLLGWVIGFRLSEPGVAEVYVALGDAAAEKIELRASAHADMHESAAAVAATAGQYQRAIERFEAALALRRASADEQDEARTLENMAEVESVVGAAGSSLEHLERASEIWARTLPGDHPALAHNEFLRAQIMLEHGDRAQALAHAEHAYATWLKVYPPDHHESVVLLRDLGRVARRAGELARAAELLTRALPLLEAEGDDPQVALTHALLGELAHDRREHAVARGHFERARR
ncbi:MAG TPA: serine/threonine-protein kinase, partial [Nannocystaceae bacterium]|nr:serine/threonine-protein kinase [Nannocystaceae bacterium]